MCLLYFFFQCYLAHRDLHSFPTRRSSDLFGGAHRAADIDEVEVADVDAIEGDYFLGEVNLFLEDGADGRDSRSEEHTSELQSRQYLVCRLLLEKKKKKKKT